MGPRRMHCPPRRLEARHSTEIDSKEPGTSEVASGAPACLKTARLIERDDDYPRVICQLNHRWRVINCRDSLQWVLQRRAGHLNGRPRWDGNSYCRSRAGLLANIEERAGDADSAALAVIKALPERHHRPTDDRWLCGRRHKAQHCQTKLDAEQQAECME